MKKLALLLLTLSAVAQLNAGWFTDDNTQQRFKAYDEMLDRQRHETGNWQLVAVVLAVGGVVLLIVGTALGSKTTKTTKNGKR